MSKRKQKKGDDGWLTREEKLLRQQQIDDWLLENRPAPQGRSLVVDSCPCHKVVKREIEGTHAPGVRWCTDCMEPMHRRILAVE